MSMSVRLRERIYDVPLEVDGKEGRPTWSGFYIAHSLLTEKYDLVLESHGEHGLQVGCCGPIQVLYIITLAVPSQRAQVPEVRARITHSKVCANSKPVENSLTFESQIVISCIPSGFSQTNSIINTHSP